ncbi:MAG TPA: PDZ domain-containing protein, partial [Vicinamibacterales bacterium]|nr:PDZ domain-containing protein [Vicinamibacterales bacterium]
RVQASYADYVWGLPPEEAPLYPSLGISVREGDGESPLSIIDVQDDSVARDAGLQAGDVLQTMDGTPVKDRETLNRLLADKRWADAVTLTVDRRGELLTITAVFRRQPPPVK